MRSDLAGVDNRVQTSLSRDTTALHTPEGGGLATQEGGAEERKNLLVVHADCIEVDFRVRLIGLVDGQYCVYQQFEKLKKAIEKYIQGLQD